MYVNFSIIADDAQLNGNISTKQHLIVNGIVNGNIASSDEVVVNGEVNGDVAANIIRIQTGTVNGNVSAKRIFCDDIANHIKGQCNGIKLPFSCTATDTAVVSNENTCICCGEIIPEGRMVCPICQAGSNP